MKRRLESFAFGFAKARSFEIVLPVLCDDSLHLIVDVPGLSGLNAEFARDAEGAGSCKRAGGLSALVLSAANGQAVLWSGRDITEHII